MKIGFDSKKYIEEQSKYILERVNAFDKMYIEFGGKIMQDLHAMRVLPGYDSDVKIKLLQTLKDDAEIIICVYAGDIESNKIRGDFGITYDMDVLRLIDQFRSFGLDVNSVVITRFDGQPAASAFQNKLEMRGIRTYLHRATKGYPTDVDTIVSDEGYGANPYIETTKKIVVVTGPGAGSGKLATSLSQIYHEHKLGRICGYSKFETFPVWNLSLNHPVNIAYEAATVELKDVNMMDSFHYDAYGVPAVNYNRDMEMFPVISRIMEKITGKKLYKSPTDMGVNRIGFVIADDEVVREAAKQEVIRRYFKTACEYKKGNLDQEVFHRMDGIMKKMDLTAEDRACVVAAREYKKEIESRPECSDSDVSVVAITLPDGTAVTGKSSNLMNGSAAAVLNAIKKMSDLGDELHLIAPMVLRPVLELNEKILGSPKAPLSLEEVLMTLSISAVTNPVAQLAMSKLKELKGSQLHSTTILSKEDEDVLRKLGVDTTCEPVFPSARLFFQ